MDNISKLQDFNRDCFSGASDIHKDSKRQNFVFKNNSSDISDKDGKGSKNSSSHFDDRIDVEDFFLILYILFCYMLHMYIIYFS